MGEVKESKKKEVEIKTKSPMWVVVLVAILVIALGCEFVYIRNLSKSNSENTNSEDQVASSDILYSNYLANIKNNINNLKQQGAETVQTEEFSLYNSETEKTETINVTLNVNEEVYINFSDGSKLADKYGNEYKLLSKIMQIFHVNANANSDSEDFIFMLNEEGKLYYINSFDLSNGYIKIEQVENLKNIINVKTEIKSSEKTNVVAIDIDGNSHDLSDIQG